MTTSQRLVKLRIRQLITIFFLILPEAKVRYPNYKCILINSTSVPIKRKEKSVELVLRLA